MHRDLVAIGATATDLDSYVVPAGGADVRIRVERRRDGWYVVLYVTIAHAKDRDPTRCRTFAARLVVGSLVTVAGVLLVRTKIRVGLASRAVLRTTIAMLAAEAARFEVATRSARLPAFACFGQ